MEDETIEWEASEFIYKEKTQDWYWILGIVAVVGAIIAVILKNSIFAIFILISAFIISVFASKKPEGVRCQINRRGIRVNEKIYTYGTIDTFWVLDENVVEPKLLLILKNNLALQVNIPLGDMDVDHVREYLGHYIHEEEQGESITERLMDLIKF